MFYTRKFLAKRGFIKPLASLLNIKEEKFRFEAAKALGELTDPKVLPYIIKSMSDESARIREIAVMACVHFKEEKVFEPLKQALKDDELNVRRAAAKALFNFSLEAQLWGYTWMAGDGTDSQQEEARKVLLETGTRAFDPVRNALIYGNWLVREKAAGIIGELGGESAVDPLCKAIDDEDADVRRIAANSLGLLKAISAVPILKKTLENKKEDMGVRRATATALTLFDPPDSLLGHVWMLAVGNKKQKETASEILKGAGADAFEPVCCALQVGNWSVRRSAADALGMMKDARAMEPLTKVLNDSDWQVRRAAAVSLGELGAKDSFEFLKKHLKDENWKVRAAVAIALGNLNDKRAVTPLIDALDDTNQNVRGAAAIGLGGIGDSAATERIIKLLKDKDETVRARAAEALAKLGDRAAVEPLAFALKDMNDDVRAAAAGALGKMKDEKAFKPLVGALNDWYSRVCLSAAESLLMLGPPSDLWGYAWLLGGGDDKEKKEATKIIRKAGPKAFDALVSAIKDWHSEVRCAAIMALGELRDPKAIEPLCQEAMRSPLNNEVILETFRAFGKIKISGIGVQLAKILDEAMFQSEDRPLVKKVLSYSRQLAKAPWASAEDKKRILIFHEKFLKN